MYVCMYACMHACMYFCGCRQVCMQICGCFYLYGYFAAGARVSTHVSMHARTLATLVMGSMCIYV